MSKNVNKRKAAPKLIFFNEKKIWNDSDDFWHRKLTLKVRILQYFTAFMQVYSRPKLFLLGWLLALSIKEEPVKCAKVCEKSWVVLNLNELSKTILTEKQWLNKKLRKKNTFFDFGSRWSTTKCQFYNYHHFFCSLDTPGSVSRINFPQRVK